jgi:hypothetical protein
MSPTGCFILINSWFTRGNRVKPGAIHQQRPWLDGGFALQCIPKVRMSMAQAAPMPKTGIPIACISLCVLPMQIDALRDRQDHRAYQRSKRHRMAQNIPRRIGLKIDECADKGRAIGD